MKDIFGREYARYSLLKKGDVVHVGGGFTCMIRGEIKTVMQRADSTFFIRCAEGQHNLMGQLADDGDSLVGIYPFALPE